MYYLQHEWPYFINTPLHSNITIFSTINIGNSGFIEKQGLDNTLGDCYEQQPTTCNKDAGSKVRLQKWSRGHLFIVRGGGFIDKWSPLFK